jgi:hypothetical protein
MLTKITVLNSYGYGKAQIKLDDCDSLQLVGPNNIGKSTLIYTLNFLFIIDGHKMTFSGHRKGDKDTIHHYFPSPTQSFIVFEIRKNSYYCILLKRDVDGELEYYKINSEYKDDFFFETEKGKQTLLSFDKVKEKLITSGIQLSTYKNKTEVFGDVYQRGKRNNGVVWLEDTVKTDGLSNNFSKVYRYLINSKLIDNKALKDALIISDNRENDAVNFSQKNKKDISDLLRINEEIKTIKAIQKDFISFREIVNQYKARTKLLAEWIYVFNQQYRPTLTDLEYRSLEKQNEITKTKTDLNEELKPKEKILFTELGGMTTSINVESTNREKIQKELNEIAGYESLEFLNQGLGNLNTERKQIELKITTIETQKLSSEQIQAKIVSITSSIERLTNQIENYSNLLVHKISKNIEDRKLINAILSPQILSLPSKRIKKEVTGITDSFKLFDGEIDIQNIELKKIESIEELEQKLKEMKQDEAYFNNLLPVAKNYEEFQNKLKDTLQKIKLIEAKIRKIESKPALEKELLDASQRIETLKANRTKAEKDLKIIEESIFRKEESLGIMSEDKKKLDSRCTELRSQKMEIEQIIIDPIEFESNDGLDTVFKKITINNNDRKEIKITKDKYFDGLKSKLNSTEADETVFISFIEDEIACLNDKENSIDGLLKSISTHFSNPAFALLAKYEDFKQFVSNKINTKLSKTRISDIESLKIVINDSKKIINDLKKISEIQDFAGQLFADLSQSENLTLLNSYLDGGKKISFEDLFDIELHLTVKGKEKKVDLAKQVESDGTDRMIRLIIIMSIIHRMIIKSDENRLAIFIDEIATIDNQNRPELIKFCNEHQFMPIFAAPDAAADFHKYYFIYPSKKQINISDQYNVMWNERS